MAFFLVVLENKFGPFGEVSGPNWKDGVIGKSEDKEDP